MLKPRSLEGGAQIYDLIPDVSVGVGYLDPLTAYHASRTALRYLFEDSPPFVTSVIRDYIDGFNGYAKIGVFSSIHYDPKNTLFGYPDEVKRASSFIKAVKALGRVAGLDDLENNYVRVMAVENGLGIPSHPDPYEGARTTMQLTGHRSVNFTNTGEIMSETDLFLMPGQAYRMRFRADPRSVLHGVHYYGEPFSVAIYTDSTPDNNLE